MVFSKPHAPPSSEIAAATAKIEDRGMSLEQALMALANAHTRDDRDVGFTVSSYADTMMMGKYAYVDAWKVVREHLHLQTEPESKP